MVDGSWTPELRRRWDEGIVRYPDPAVEVLDPRFGAYRLGNAAIERLYTGARWAEGPGVVWRFQVAGFQRYSEQPDAAVLRGDG